MALDKHVAREILQDLDISFVNHSSTQILAKSDSDRICLYVKNHNVRSLMWEIYEYDPPGRPGRGELLITDIDNEFDFQDWFITNFEKYR